MTFNYSLLLLTVIFTMNTEAQILNKHQWKHRVILLLANDTDNSLLDSQLKEFKIKSNGFKDRKLILYSVLPKKYKLLNSENNDWIENTEFYEAYHTGSKNFEIILIGLDGGVKLRQDSILSTEKLFATIDAMPMRKAEMKRNR